MRFTFFLFVLLLISSNIIAQRFKTLEYKDTVDLSSVNFQPLKVINNIDFESFSIFDSAIFKSNVFFIGENHTYRNANTNLQIAMIEYLNKSIGLNHIVMEFGFARGWLVDQYINSEDSIYQEVLRLYSFPEYYNYYKKLRKLNMSLPDSLRINVLGIDVERFHDTPLKTLSLLLPKDSIPSDSIAMSIESLKGIAGYLDNYFMFRKNRNYDSNKNQERSNYSSKTFDSEETANSLVYDFFKHEQYYKVYLCEDNFKLYKIIITELRDNQIYQSYESQPQQHVYRERYMYSKFMDYYGKHLGDKVFGQFGRCHVADNIQDNPCQWYNFSSIVSRINNSKSPFLNDKVCSISFFYSDDDSYNESIKKNGAISQIFAKASELDTIVAIEVTSDTLLFGNYSEFYDFLIYDNRIIEESALVEEANENVDMSDNANGNFAFYFGAQNSRYDFNDFNNYLSNNGFSKLQNIDNKFVFGIQINRQSGFCLGYNILISKEQKSMNIIDTVGLIYGNAGFFMDLGYNILNSNHILIKPQFSFGGNSHSLEISQGEEKIYPELDFLGGSLIERFNFSTFVLDPNIELILKFGNFGIGARTGYYYSFNASSWKNINGDDLVNSPKINTSGLYAQVAAYFIFGF